MAEANRGLHDPPPMYNPGNHYYIEGDKLHDRPVPAPHYLPEDSLPLSDKDDYDCVKKKNLESQREDLRCKFQELRERLDKKEKSIIDCLNDTAPVDNEIGDLRKGLVNMYTTKRNLEAGMEDLELSHTLNVAYRGIVDQIYRTEKMLKTNLYIKWDISGCERAIDNLCTLCEGRNFIDTYRTKKELLWESLKSGTERTQVHGPVGMTIEPKTDRIVIADAGNNRLQIYSSTGNHLFEIALVLNKVVFFSFLGESLFIIAVKDRQFLVTKMKSLNGSTDFKTLTKLDKSYNDFFTNLDICSLFLLDMKKNTNLTLTICIYKNNHKLSIFFLSYDTLEETPPDGDVHVELHSPYIKDHTVATCVKVVGLTHKLTQFYVMYHNAPFAVQVFNWNGEMVRGIVDKITLTNVRSIFHVDQEGYIIICTVERTFDDKQNKDKQPADYVVQTLYSNYVYSIDDGKRQHKWTYKCTNRDSVLQTLRKPFQRSLLVGKAKARDVVGAAPYFDACLNSRQVLMILHVPEHVFLLRAF